MTTHEDRELLELAARAAGIEVPKPSPWGGIDERGVWKDISGGGDGTRFWRWDPLTDDGDALRLAVKLQLLILPAKGGQIVAVDGYTAIDEATENCRADPYAATRRAIVRAAAHLGEGMKK